MRNLIRNIANRGTSSHNAMIYIATSAVAISIAVVIITLSVIFGFKTEISALVTGSVSDITIFNPYAGQHPELHPINDSQALRSFVLDKGNFSHIERYALRTGIIRGKEGATGAMLRGVGTDADLSLFSEQLECGTLPQIEGNRRKEVVISKGIAATIGAKCNDRIELILMDSDDTPRREIFKICGIYRSALGDTGAELVLTDIRNVQKLNNWSAEQISGYACRLHDNEFSKEIAEYINIGLMYKYQGDESVSAISAREEFSHIFGWLETHDVNAIVVLTIMIIVAIFNMVTALLILVLERTRMVGILKSLGMPNSMLRRIFTYRTARIIAWGIAIGNASAILLLLLQKYLHIIKLDESGYFLSEVPVSLDAGWIVGINLLFVVITITATYLATSIVGRIKVAEAIKYN